MKKETLHEVNIFALDLAIRAGEVVIQERINNRLDCQYKSDQELVTHADLKVDELICGRINKIYPEHRILSEETHPDKLQAEDLDHPIWIIDPIDGTVNYAYGHHQVAVSVAFACEGKVQVGVVHCPFQSETFNAMTGEPALLNHRPIKVSHKPELKSALIATGFPYRKDGIDKLTKRLTAVLKQCRDIRRIGSAAIDICWVACGRLDGYYESLSPWDFAAAKLIAEQAGASTGHIYPPPENRNPALFSEDLLISTPEIYTDLQKLLTETDQSALA